jgi:hypothetical protein
MNWLPLNETRVLADFPTDLKPQYDAWLVAHPDKAGRLVEIIEQIVSEFRSAIATNPVNVLDAETEKLPENCIRSAEVLIYGTLQNEMGVALSSGDAQAMTRAEIFLRQIGYGHFAIENESREPTPHYTTSTNHPERTLP